MKKNLKDVLTASMCRFTVGVDINGELVPKISADACEKPCDYCMMASEYLYNQIMELDNVVQQPTEGSHREDREA